MDASTVGSQQEDSSNVLFEPEIYRPQEEEDDAMDGQSTSTHHGLANMSMVSSYKTDLDPSLFAAQKM